MFISWRLERPTYDVSFDNSGKYLAFVDTRRSWFSRTFAREIFRVVFCLSARSTASGRDSFNCSAETCPAPKSVQHKIIARTGVDGLAVLDLTTVTSTGITRSVKNIEKIRPNAMTLAKGLQRLDPERIMGTMPTAAAIEVRKIGRSRRAPASRAACSREAPSAIL